MADPSRPITDDDAADPAATPDGPDAVARDLAPGEASAAQAIGDEIDAPESIEDVGLDPTLKAATAPSPGTLLREAREARELDVADLARTLNLQPRIILALERDDDAALPSPAFVRGYIRSYARLIGLAPEPLLAQYDARTGGVVVGVRPSPRIEYAGDSVGVVQRRPGLVMAVVTVGVVALLGAAVLLLWPDAPAPLPTATPDSPAPTASSSRAQASLAAASEQGLASEPAAVTDTQGQGADAPAPAPAVDGAAPAAQSRPQADPGPAADEAEDELAPDALDAAVLEDAIDGIQRTRSADGLDVRVFAGGEDHLHFTFTEECWVEIRDADDAEVYADLARELETLDLWGRAPFRIRLGYAPAVELTYNGSRVALRPHTRNDVASLVLGR